MDDHGWSWMRGLHSKAVFCVWLPEQTGAVVFEVVCSCLLMSPVSSAGEITFPMIPPSPPPTIFELQHCNSILPSCLILLNKYIPDQLKKPQSSDLKWWPKQPKIPENPQVAGRNAEQMRSKCGANAEPMRSKCGANAEQMRHHAR